MRITLDTPSGQQYHRCVLLGQWQNAANIRGCTVHQVRLEHDWNYEAPKTEAQAEVEDWRVDFRRRLIGLDMTIREFCELTARSYSSMSKALEGTWAISDRLIAVVMADLRRLEIEEGAECSR